MNDDTLEKDRNMISKAQRPEWTEPVINRFWDRFASQKDTSEKYFSRMWATQLAKILEDTGRLSGRVLDYGCGPGYLLEKIITWDIQCFGCDPSPESVTQTNSRLAKFANWNGCLFMKGTPTAYAPASFDVITCIETIEHLSDTLLDETMAEISRLLKPGGMLLITTPFEEDLEVNFHYCPFCNSEFHRMQHIQTWTVSNVEDLFRRHHITPFLGKGIRLASYGLRPTLGSVFSYGIRRIPHILKFRWLALLDKLAPKPFPQGRITQTYDLKSPGRNLVAIGFRSERR
jgi:SAM-dependent methyltransferase